MHKPQNIESFKQIAEYMKFTLYKRSPDNEIFDISASITGNVHQVMR